MIMTSTIVLCYVLTNLHYITLHSTTCIYDMITRGVAQGFLVLRQKVPTAVLTAAKKAINARLGQPGRSFVPHTGSADTSKRRPPSGFDETELPLEQEEDERRDGERGGGDEDNRKKEKEKPLFNGRLGVSSNV